LIEAAESEKTNLSDGGCFRSNYVYELSIFAMTITLLAANSS